MSTEIEIGKAAAKGVLHVFSGKMVSRIIGFFGGVFLMRLLADPTKYGLISVASILPQIFLLFTDLGIDTAMTKYIAENRVKRDFKTVRSLFYSGLLIKVAVASLFTILCMAASSFLSTALLGKSHVAPFMAIASLMILSWALSSFSRSAFMGFDTTRIYGIFLVVNELLISFMPIILVLYGFDVFGALVGMTSAMGITALLETAACIVIIQRMSKESSPRQRSSVNFKSSARDILTYGLPMQVVALMSAGMGRFYHFLIASTSPDDQVGYFSTSEKSYAFTDYVAWPVRLVLFPAFAKIDPTNQREGLNKTLKYSVKYSSLIILPILVSLIILAHPLIVFLFGVEYEYASVYLSIMSIFGLAYGLGKGHFRKLLLAQGDTRFVAKIDALGALIGIGLAIILIQQFQIFGFLLLEFLLTWPSYFLMIRKARRDYEVSVPLEAVWKLYMAALIAGTATFFALYLTSNVVLKLFIGVSMVLVVYVLSVLAIGGLNLTDFENLKEMTIDQPIVGVFLKKSFEITEKIYLRFHPGATT